jgi:Lrp/AsnC family transcriptional regulator, leucine-responsive regulatory protein
MLPQADLTAIFSAMLPRRLYIKTQYRPLIQQHSMLDRTDLRILEILQQNGRIPNKDIATMIGRSNSRVFERIKRLKEDGFIQKIVAVLDHKLINRSFIVFALVSLKEHSHKMFLHFETQISQLDEVMECYYMSGEGDFMLKIAVADMDRYNEFLVSRLSGIHEVDTVKSYFVMK